MASAVGMVLPIGIRFTYYTRPGNSGDIIFERLCEKHLSAAEHLPRAFQVFRGIHADPGFITRRFDQDGFTMIQRP